MRTTILCVFLLGCSSGPPTIYGQGIPVTPSAPTFNPTWDAHITTGQPGYIGSPERAPRGTDKRVLPPSKEAGIWASGTPPSGRKMYTLMFPETDYEYPLPDETEPAEFDRVKDCGRAIYRSTIEANMLDVIKRLSMVERRCVLSKMYDACTREGISIAEAVGKKHGFDSTHRELWWVRLKQTASVDAKTACSLVPDMDALKSIIDATMRSFNEVKGEFIHT